MNGYRERLVAPLRWWVQATMVLASLLLAFVVAMPAWAAFTATGVAAAVTYGVLVAWGRVTVEVAEGRLLAGRAQIPLALLGEPEALDAAETRRVHGVDADARAYLLTRPYLTRSVRVAVLDPGDPAPYWLLSSRHPQRLAAAIAAGAHETAREP